MAVQQRLQKLIAQAGFASRRRAETLIAGGQVTVNGKVVVELGSKADWDTDRIAVNGKPLRRELQLRYLLFYKPKGVVSTMSDPQRRPAIADYIHAAAGIKERLFPVGRLDFHSEGLILLTNDGELANHLLHASLALPKTYWVKVSGQPGEEQLERLRRGVVIEGRHTAPAQIRWLRSSPATGRQRRQAGVYRTSKENPWLEVVLIEGRYHQIRKMFLAVGHPVEKLKRVAIGKLTIGQLQSGKMRALTPAELHDLQTAGRPSRQLAGPGVRQGSSSKSWPPAVAPRQARPSATGAGGQRATRHRDRA
ncbi:MAG: pseudouridine synthase [Terriglobales bacterium]